MGKGSKTGKSRQGRERAIRFIFFGVALASIATLGLIALFLFAEGLPILKKVSVTDFVFGKFWYPTDEPPDFGIHSLAVSGSSTLSNTRSRASLSLHSALTPDLVRQCCLTPVGDLNAFVRERILALGKGVPVAVLPEGPLTIPYLA